MSRERFIKLLPGERRPGRIPLPPPFQIKARTEDTEGRLSLLEVTLVRDIPRHTDHLADEMIYVLEGELGVHFDGEDQTHNASERALVEREVESTAPRRARRPGRGHLTADEAECADRADPLDWPGGGAGCSGCAQHGGDPTLSTKGMCHAQRFQREA
ncbi:hypothetical protein [Streptomyces sp. KS 21]|uniref:hypothetical protein n=1 Tax=Streptomyces sp. KS 21 TaxID=2485150 RepID=UPI0010642E9F|nr:hypothetical protein [Streptomyces sp. KS 21]TDU73713.1 hypothetical protein EDD91_0313 [Streptomyces sp. KS 21]